MILKNNLLIYIFLVYFFYFDFAICMDFYKFKTFSKNNYFFVENRNSYNNNKNLKISEKVLSFLETLLIKQKDAKIDDEIKSEIIHDPNEKSKFSNYEDFIPFDEAELKILDKVENKKINIIVKKNQKYIFNDLQIKLEKCLSSKEYNSESIINLEILNKFDKKEIFNGWIFSKYPNLTYIDHKKFDFIVAKCI